MNNLNFLIIFHLFLLFFSVESQQTAFQFDENNNTSNFQPSLGVVLGVLAGMFLLTFLLLIYVKLFHSRSVANGSHSDPIIHPSQTRSSSGIDKTVIESLPFFRFSSLKGSKDGLECSVCLSKFEEVEILRLLPKCKHAFHIDCIDHWLEKHSSCPLCRRRISPEDMSLFKLSNSMRSLWMNRSELNEDSNVEIFVQREEDDDPHGGSLRFNIGSSFRKIIGKKDRKDGNDMLIQKDLHKHNHKIIVSDFIFKNRWSDLGPSDLTFLNTEMIACVSSNRFCLLESDIENNDDQILKIKEGMEMKRLYESRIGTNNANPDSGASTSDSGETARISNSKERRSVSEITVMSRFSNMEKNVKEEKRRQLWYPIARRTVQLFGSRETSS